MTKLICPECHLTIFGISKPTERDVLTHVLNVHGKRVSARGEHRYRARQDRAWEALVTENEEAFEVAKEERMRAWERFANDGSRVEVLGEKGLDHLHATRAMLMDVDEDEYGESSEDDHEDDVFGDESKAANDRFGTGPGYADSLRYHQNGETRLLAEERMAAFTRAVPSAASQRLLHGNTNIHRSQEQQFEDDFPDLVQRSDQLSSSSSPSPDVLKSILERLESINAALASSESGTGDQLSQDAEYEADDEDNDEEE